MMDPTPEQVAEIILRSSRGESVAITIRNMDLPIDETLEYMKRHHNDLKAAKETFSQSERLRG